jgi:flagellar motility protein MotE (MotC chaperone)
MIKKLLSPMVLAVFVVLLSVGMGVTVFSRVAAPLIAQAAAASAAKVATQEKKVKAKGWDFWTIEVENLSNELKEGRARLSKQSELLDQREARLKAEEKELAKVRTEIENLRKEIGNKVTEITADESKNIRSLAQTYTSLTPKAVVAIFREMDDTTAVKILSLMKPDTVGPIFEQMSTAAGPDGLQARRAAILSEKLRLMKASKPASSS